MPYDPSLTSRYSDFLLGACEDITRDQFSRQGIVGLLQSGESCGTTGQGSADFIVAHDVDSRFTILVLVRSPSSDTRMFEDVIASLTVLGIPSTPAAPAVAQPVVVDSYCDTSNPNYNPPYIPGILIEVWSDGSTTRAGFCTA